MKKQLLFFLLCSSITCGSVSLMAQTFDSLNLSTSQLFDLSLEELLQIPINKSSRQLKLYGYINTNAEKQFGFPRIDGEGKTSRENDPFA